ncbi:MAG: hypothetical protein H8E35_03250 [Ardenticatenia bacterium]|nr:hypothetical protein [Ardenticatenia bacterium]
MGASANDDGRRQDKIALADLWGPSLVQYECDVGIILNPGERVDDGNVPPCPCVISQE